jgi:hypothetical protein
MGNRGWEALVMKASVLRRVLRLLAQGHWQLSAGMDEGLRLWAEAEESVEQHEAQESQ